MFRQLRPLFLLMIMLVAAGCARAVSVVSPNVNAVDATDVTATLQYLERLDEGPAYNVSLTVPDSWVGRFETRNIGNVLYFDYLNDNGTKAQLFSVEALSEAQYWKMSGAYPNSHTNLVNRGDTLFVYHLPIDAYYSGLDEATFDMLSADVPAIVASFSATEAN